MTKQSNVPLQFVTALSEALRTTQKLLVVTHGNPDGDALASLSACISLCSSRVTHCTGYADRYGGEYLRALPHVSTIQSASSRVDLADYDTVIFVDAHTFERANLHTPKRIRSFAIDHHPWEHKTIAEHVWIDTAYPSATSMLFHLFKALRVGIDMVTANVLLCGIITDTELFQNHATNALAFRIVGELTQLGADLVTMKRFGLNALSFETVKAMGSALERVTLNTRFKTGLVVLDESSKLKEVLASVVKRTRMPDTTFVIKSKPTVGRVEVSLRSSAKNVGMLAKILGGGGHPRAAAFRFSGRVVEQDGKMVIL